MLLPTVDETCRGKTSDGSQCPCLRPKIRKDQKDDEPVVCINCGHYDTSHPQEAILQQPPSTSSSFGSIMSKYSHLLSKSGACEEVARRETNLGFRKQDTALLASTSHMAKVGVRSGSSKDTIKVRGLPRISIPSLINQISCVEDDCSKPSKDRHWIHCNGDCWTCKYLMSSYVVTLALISHIFG
jgi:hypothetical protein